MHHLRIGPAACLMVVFALVLGASEAALGQTTINQTKAVNGNVTPGDAPGFPVTISQAGSYRLTGHLDVRGLTNPQNITVIEITADNVHLNLNGRSILGPNVCSGSPPTCTQPGLGRGVLAATASHITVVNGIVDGVGKTGIDLKGSGNRVESVQARNGEFGIIVGAASRVTGSTAQFQSTAGMWVGSGGVVTNNTASNNAVGIRAAASTVTSNTARNNSHRGLELDTTSGYTDNILTGNNDGVTQISGGIALGPTFEFPAASTTATTINQTKANNGNVTPGDSAGFPVSITVPGTYRLTGNLTVADANTTAILISSNDVFLDLNGFAILGPNVCSGSPTVCSLPGNGDGIKIEDVSRVVIVNGSVRGVGDLGVAMVGSNQHSIAIERVTVSHTGDFAIVVFGRSLVRNCTVRQTERSGILVVGPDALVTGNTVEFNDRGIDISVGSAGRGFVTGNTARANFREGLRMTSPEIGYGNNVFTGNGAGSSGQQVSGGYQMAPNVCGTTTCPP